ncbi:MAG TPA: hydroxyacylglutathione hydrolase [Rhodanobacteraceae bacterium]|nr:hydroxyacylglutathione hydrolase [Rhodanobacteraceae bacterium]
MLQLSAIPAFADNYIWALTDESGATLVVDPGDATPVQAWLDQRGWHLTAILITHHHNDHIGGLAELAACHRAPVWTPRDTRIDGPWHRVSAGDRIEIERPASRFEVIEVPGHTLSHVAYVGETCLFSGDTLFSLGCGRLFEGSPAQMLASLDRLSVLPGDTRVCCGHEYTLANAAFAFTVDTGNDALQRQVAEARALRADGHPSLPTTLEAERQANPFLRIDSPALKAWANAHGAGANRVDRFAALRAAKDVFRA